MNCNAFHMKNTKSIHFFIHRPLDFNSISGANHARYTNGAMCNQDICLWRHQFYCQLCRYSWRRQLCMECNLPIGSHDFVRNNGHNSRLMFVILSNMSGYMLYRWFRTTACALFRSEALKDCRLTTPLLLYQGTTLRASNLPNAMTPVLIYFTMCPCTLCAAISAAILSIRHDGTYFSEILFKIEKFSFKEMHLKTSSAKWRPFSLVLNVLITNCDRPLYLLHAAIV